MRCSQAERAVHSPTADTTLDVRVNAKLVKQATQPKDFPLNRCSSKCLRDTIAASRGGNSARLVSTVQPFLSRKGTHCMHVQMRWLCCRPGRRQPRWPGRVPPAPHHQQKRPQQRQRHSIGLQAGRQAGNTQAGGSGGTSARRTCRLLMLWADTDTGVRFGCAGRAHMREHSAIHTGRGRKCAATKTLLQLDSTDSDARVGAQWHLRVFAKSACWHHHDASMQSEPAMQCCVSTTSPARQHPGRQPH